MILSQLWSKCFQHTSFLQQCMFVIHCTTSNFGGDWLPPVMQSRYAFQHCKLNYRFLVKSFPANQLSWKLPLLVGSSPVWGTTGNQIWALVIYPKDKMILLFICHGNLLMIVGCVCMIYNIIDYLIPVFYNALLQYLINELKLKRGHCRLLCPARATVIHQIFGHNT